MPLLFDTTKMSPDEFKFIRLYCSSIRRDYHAMSTAIALTDPAELGLTCPFTIAKLAFGLEGMYREYAHKFASLGSPEKAGSYLPTLLPSLDDVGHLFSISFFKIVDSATKLAIVTAANKTGHDGWSSGRPADWQHSLKSLYDIQKQQPSGGSSLGVAFQKLFSVFMSYSFSTLPESPDPDDDYYDDEYDYDADDDGYDDYDYYN